MDNFTEGLFNYCKNHEMEKSGYLIEPSCNDYPHVTKGDCSNAVNYKSVMDKMGLSKDEMKTLLTQLNDKRKLKLRVTLRRYYKDA